MLMQRPLDGTGVTVPTIVEGYRGPFPSATTRATRRVLARVLAISGLSGIQVGQVLNLPRSTISEALKAVDEPEADATPPPDEPPGIEAPAPRPRPTVVNVSERLVAGLRRDYSPGVPTDDGRQLGDLPEVREWLATLKPGRVSPAD